MNTVHGLELGPVVDDLVAAAAVAEVGLDEPGADRHVLVEQLLDQVRTALPVLIEAATAQEDLQELVARAQAEAAQAEQALSWVDTVTMAGGPWWSRW